MNYYMLVASAGVDLSDRPITADQIARARMLDGEWPLYAKTRLKLALKSTDKCLVYLSGPPSVGQRFIGQFIVKELITAPSDWQEPIPDLLGTPASNLLLLENVEMFDPPVEIRPLLNKLALTKGKRLWGSSIMGGVTKQTESDYRKIV